MKCALAYGQNAQNFNDGVIRSSVTVDSEENGVIFDNVGAGTNMPARSSTS